ncbi:MAG: hypothetical protein AAF449_09755 [Myxococcota bacterium]
MTFFGLFGLWALSSATSSVQDFLPCDTGRVIEYRWHEADGRGTKVVRTDRVLEYRKSLCFVERTTRDPDHAQSSDIFVREYQHQRVLDAGWKGQLTAFRAPLLQGPLQQGRQWRFNRVQYRLHVWPQGVQIPAGHYPDVIRVDVRSVIPGRYRAVRTYARNIGLIEDRRPEGAWVAFSVTHAR